MNTIDARGMRCPWPVLRTARMLREDEKLPLEIFADDPNAEAELIALAKCKGLQFKKLHNGHFQLTEIA